MNLDDALQTFFAEADELLQSMESALLRLEEGSADDETLNEIFRAVHTIKGSAGLFGLEKVVGFTHVVENLLDRARAAEILIDEKLQGILLRCRDHIHVLIQDLASQRQTSEETYTNGEQLLIQLFPWLEIPETDDPPKSTTIAEVAQPDEESPRGRSEAWHISLRLNSEVLRNGMDPLSFIRYLNSIGNITQIVTLEEHLPENIDGYDAEVLYLGFEIDLKTDASFKEIEEVFGFVESGSTIQILPPHSKVSEYIKLIRLLPESNQQLGEILVKSGALTQASLDWALDAQTVQAAQNNEMEMLGEILTSDKTVAPEVVDAALDKQKKFSQKRASQENKFIRVDSDKLDNLINLIGELVISRQRVDLLAGQTGHDQLLNAVSDLGGFTEHIRDAALTLRMVPIGDTFQRFRRVVRDTAADLGKSIDLKIRGAETELDRSMVEKLTDPLTHIVRNAIDHGIEEPQTRLEQGKPETGTLLLSAYHDAGIIVIEIRDDGAGLNIDKIREKAVAKGVIEADSPLSEYDLNQLIFHPGLSTAEQVTNLSGRGVGMDVVKRNIDTLQGSIEIESSPGVGTRIRIRLPLTLAIIDGFHVTSRNTHFIIPQNTVLECMDLSVLKKDEGRNCVNLRGEQTPTIRLSQIYALPLVALEIEGHKEELVVVQFGGSRAGIIVEDLFGEVQTVVKPLSPLFQSLQGIGGSSLLGSGDIAFILDIPQLIELAVKQESKTNRVLS